MKTIVLEHEIFTCDIWTKHLNEFHYLIKELTGIMYSKNFCLIKLVLKKKKLETEYKLRVPYKRV